mgnify:CR=1 FL=1
MANIIIDSKSEEFENIKEFPLQDKENISKNFFNNNKNKESKSLNNLNSEFKEEIREEISNKNLKNENHFRQQKNKDLNDQEIPNNLNREFEREIDNKEKYKEKNVLPIRKEIKSIPRIYKQPNIFSVK